MPNPQAKIGKPDGNSVRLNVYLFSLFKGFACCFFHIGSLPAILANDKDRIGDTLVAFCPVLAIFYIAFHFYFQGKPSLK